MKKVDDFQGHLCDRAFSAAGPKLWNELPLSLRSANTLTVFKKDLKTYLFKLAFSY